MESLSPQCTPLKHRYDSCFNLWFEGYLQPALDGQPAQTILKPSSPQQSSLSKLPSDPSSSTPPPEILEPAQLKRPIVTNWAAVFTKTKPNSVTSADPSGYTNLPEQPSGDADRPLSIIGVDTKGKTRAQIKAEEYERSCGEAWRDYRTCLTRAIEDNESLSALLQQAREEHPLRNQDNLSGTPWDPKADFATAS